eukprot:CAMPEP_0194445500 /NCGR_PEP_ID=MMETSP0176-20130528/127901_1 /TAXON_ID=216777 /ORGANISM="Proboscia alata, Strain PI-D3" /LENGTH=557 /DNA_ID=CAMNT_0039272075 /DNA_START=39 /DNA_END=1713 /DNA_ORIENTATION=+
MTFLELTMDEQLENARHISADRLLQNFQPGQDDPIRSCEDIYPVKGLKVELEKVSGCSYLDNSLNTMATCDSSCEGSPQNELILNRFLPQRVTAFEEESDEGNRPIIPKNANDSSSDAYTDIISKEKDNVVMQPIHECSRIPKLPMITTPIHANETRNFSLSNSESCITRSIMKVKTLEESISGKSKRGDIRVVISETAVDFDTCHIREYERELGDTRLAPAPVKGLKVELEKVSGCSYLDNSLNTMATCDSSCEGSPQNELILNRFLPQRVTAFEEESDEGNRPIIPKNANDSSSDAYTDIISKEKDNVVMQPIHECSRIPKLPMITTPIHANETRNFSLSNSESCITRSIMKVKTLEESISGKSKRGDIRVVISETAVDFDTCHIREYERELGDNPSCSSGAPVSLGWNFVEIGVFPFEEFEMSRSKKCDDMDKSVHGKRRASIAHTVLTRTAREKLLMDHGFSRKEIAEATRINIKMKNNRRQTVNNLKFQKVEEFFEALRRYFRRVKKSGKKDVDVDRLLYEQRAAFASIKIQEEHDACVLDISSRRIRSRSI